MFTLALLHQSPLMTFLCCHCVDEYMLCWCMVIGLLYNSFVQSKFSTVGVNTSAFRPCTLMLIEVTSIFYRVF